MNDTVLIFGSPAHPGLSAIQARLLQRARRRVVFVVEDTFLEHCRFYLESDFDRGVLMLSQSQPLRFPELCSVCLDGLYVPASAVQGFHEADASYIQTETWAAMIALFDQLSSRIPVANFLRNRSVSSTRWSVLRHLAARGLPVPEAMVTSDPAAVEEFLEKVRRAVFKPVGDATSKFRELDEAALERLDRLSLAPVHFEEAPQGSIELLVLIGERTFCFPGRARVPDALVERCREVTSELGLLMSEVPLRLKPCGRWQVTDVRTFPTAAVLDQSQVAEAAAELLEALP